MQSTQAHRSRWWAVLALAGAGVFGCADASPDHSSAQNAAQISPIAVLTPAQVLGAYRAIATASNREAAVAYGANDDRIGALTNRIADARIAQDKEIDAIAAQLGVTPVDSPLSIQIAAQSARDVAVLRSAGADLANMYIDGLVLSQARALGLVDYMLAPSSAHNEALNAFTTRVRAEWVAQLESAQQIQVSRRDWRLDSVAPFPNAEPVPPPR